MVPIHLPKESKAEWVLPGEKAHFFMHKTT
jgi:hypothetical protein